MASVVVSTESVALPVAMLGLGGTSLLPFKVALYISVIGVVGGGV
ncbi:hypothetical protein [Undibacterium sp.]|nr:hypothetical protein [Undibacterium sp.]HTD05392.1 hypothetical protein [Undibacterium sp.]